MGAGKAIGTVDQEVVSARGHAEQVMLKRHLPKSFQESPKFLKVRLPDQRMCHFPR